MADDGLIFTQDDSDFTAKMNRKSLVVGRGSQLANLTTTYEGQTAYCTVTENGFTIDKLSLRNTVNNTWFNKKNLTESAEQNSTPVSDNTEGGSIQNLKAYAHFTLPTTEKFYIITGIEWKNGTVVGGNVMCGVEQIDADPPVANGVQLLAFGREVAQTPINSIQRNNDIVSKLILGGTIIGAWILFDSGLAKIRFQDPLANDNRQKALTYTIDLPTSDSLAWGPSTAHRYMKIYFKGYSYI